MQWLEKCVFFSFFYVGWIVMLAKMNNRLIMILTVRQTSKEAKDKARPKHFCDLHCEREDDSQYWLKQELIGFQINHDRQHNHPLCLISHNDLFIGLRIARIIAGLSGKVVRLLRWLALSMKGDDGCALSRFPPKYVVEFAQEDNSISFCFQIFHSVSQEGRVKEGLGSKRGDHKVGPRTTNTSPC